MSAQFDWQSEEGREWVNRSGRSEPHLTRPPGRRWLWVLALLVLAAGLIGSGLLVIRRQIAAATRRAEAEVRASQALHRQALERGDVELLATVLSGRDPAWARTQQALLAAGFEAPAEALGLRPGEASSTTPFVNLDEALSAAEVVWRRPFTWQSSDGTTLALVLEHTDVYRRGATHWLFAPPSSGFWGEMRLEDDGRLAVAYPARDAGVIPAIVNAIWDRLAELCQSGGLDPCPPPDFAVTLRLQTDPAVLLPAADGQTRWATGLDLSLPTPSLIGRPVDEFGVAALAAIYADVVIQAVQADLVDYRCCAHYPFFRALADFEAAQRGQVAWPVGRTEYERLLQAPSPLALLNSLWDLDAPVPLTESWPVYVWVEYWLSREDAPTLGAARRRLGRAADFGAWIDVADAPARKEAELIDDWLRYAHSRGGAARPELPAGASWPNQDVILACQRGTEISVWRYRVAQDSWSRLVAEAQDGPGRVQLRALPGQDGFALSWIPKDGHEAAWWTRIWRQGTVLTELGPAESPAPLLFTGRSTPDGHRLLLSSARPELGVPTYLLLDLNGCGPAGCDLTPLTGLPAWSPHGRQFIVNRQATLWLGDEATGRQIELARGQFPFWLDEETYGYVGIADFRPDEMGIMTANLGLFVGDSGGDPAQLRFSEADLWPLVPAAQRTGARPESLKLLYAMNTLDGNDQIIVVALMEEKHLFLLFRVQGLLDPEKQAAAMAFFQAQTGRRSRLLLAPGGRWLALLAEVGAANWEVALYALDSDAFQRTVAYFAPPAVNNNWAAWSLDGGWFLGLSAGHFRLLAPAHDYQAVVFHDFEGCQEATWLTSFFPPGAPPAP